MSTPINDGGPAFPVTPTDRSGQIAETYCGMTLRDWFAGQALAGLLANRALNDQDINTRAAQWFSEMSFRSADAMLAARERKEPTK